jgi:hypothetical protein
VRFHCKCWGICVEDTDLIEMKHHCTTAHDLVCQKLV